MPWTIIVASSQADQLDELVSGAEEIAAQIESPGGTPIVSATSVDDVCKRRRSAAGRKQLLIIAASLPNRQSSPDREAEPGLALIRAMGNDPEPPWCILVSDQLEHYRAVQDMKYCEWLAVDCKTNYVEQCLKLARKHGIIPEVRASVPEKRAAAAAEQVAPDISYVPSPPLANIPVPDPIPIGLVDLSPAGPLQRPDETQNPYALIELEVPTDARFATVSLEIHEGACIKKQGPEPLHLNQSEVDKLVQDSQALKKQLSDALQDPDRRYHGQWQMDYRALGERVTSLLWPTRFRDLYYQGYGAADGNVRLRFSLEQPCFDGLWEAIFDALGQRFMMLDNMIARRARSRDRLSIFSKEMDQQDPASGSGVASKVLHVLVIQSDVPDGSAPEGPDDVLWEEYWASLQADLAHLPHLEDEVRIIRRLQRAQRGAKGARAQLEVDLLKLRASGRPSSLAKRLERTLKDPSRRYDIVHFAGHALFVPNANKGDGRGYLIFSGHPKPTAVPIAKVASWLEKSGVQLVYLSCCRSSAAPAALEFARHNIPMTIGFHWDLDDRKAVDFAENFYRALLEFDLKVCPAMREARRSLYESYDAGDPIWASPVLVAQPSDWIQVEVGIRPAAHRRRASASAGRWGAH